MRTRGRKTRHNLTPSDKMHAILRIQNGETKASVSRDIGVPESTLRGWCKKTQKFRSMCHQLEELPSPSPPQLGKPGENSRAKIEIGAPRAHAVDLHVGKQSINYCPSNNSFAATKGENNTTLQNRASQENNNNLNSLHTMERKRPEINVLPTELENGKPNINFLSLLAAMAESSKLSGHTPFNTLKSSDQSSNQLDKVLQNLLAVMKGAEPASTPTNTRTEHDAEPNQTFPISAGLPSSQPPLSTTGVDFSDIDMSADRDFKSSLNYFTQAAFLVFLKQAFSQDDKNASGSLAEKLACSFTGTPNSSSNEPLDLSVRPTTSSSLTTNNYTEVAPGMPAAAPNRPNYGSVMGGQI